MHIFRKMHISQQKEDQDREGLVMASIVNEAKYEAMISALNKFASTVYTKSSEMQSLATVCRSALGDTDEGSAEIYKKISECQVKYADAAKEARDIAAQMQEELDEQRKEREVWANDDIE